MTLPSREFDDELPIWAETRRGAASTVSGVYGVQSTNGASDTDPEDSGGILAISRRLRDSWVVRSIGFHTSSAATAPLAIWPNHQVVKPQTIEQHCRIPP